MIGVTRKEGTKGKIILEIPEENFQQLRDDFGQSEIDELIMMDKEKYPEEGPYFIKLDKFHIQQISESNLDRNQIVETNEFPMFFSFGKGAETHSYQMQIIDGGRNLSGQGAFWLDLYERFYELARPHNILDYNMDFTMYYADKRVRGLWYNMSYQKSSEMDKVVGANFKFFVIEKSKRAQVG